MLHLLERLGRSGLLCILRVLAIGMVIPGAVAEAAKMRIPPQAIDGSKLAPDPRHLRTFVNIPAGGGAVHTIPVSSK